MEKENARLRRVVSDMTLDYQILKEVVRRKFYVLHANVLQLILRWKSLARLSARPAAWSASTAPLSESPRPKI